jgi:hypothetical protein
MHNITIGESHGHLATPLTGHRLTLAPGAESRDLVDAGLHVNLDDEESCMLHREQMARAMDI